MHGATDFELAWRNGLAYDACMALLADLPRYPQEMSGKDVGLSAIDVVFGSTMLRETYVLPENILGQSIETREFQWRITYPEVKEGAFVPSFVSVVEASLRSEQVRPFRVSGACRQTSAPLNLLPSLAAQCTGTVLVRRLLPSVVKICGSWGLLARPCIPTMMMSDGRLYALALWLTRLVLASEMSVRRCRLILVLCR